MQTLLQHSENCCSSQHLCMSTVKVPGEIAICPTLFSILAEGDIYEFSCFALALPEERIKIHLCSQKYCQQKTSIGHTTYLYVIQLSSTVSVLSTHTPKILFHLLGNLQHWADLYFINVMDCMARVKLSVRLENQFYKSLKYITRGLGLWSCYYWLQYFKSFSQTVIQLTGNLTFCWGGTARFKSALKYSLEQYICEQCLTWIANARLRIAWLLRRWLQKPSSTLNSETV